MGKDKRELWSLYLSTVRDMTKKWKVKEHSRTVNKTREYSVENILEVNREIQGHKGKME